jgi:hypothetical protein
MTDKIVDRCKVICGGVYESCIIDNPRHLDCIADMVINKTSVISLLLGRVLRESPDDTVQNTHDAMTISNELGNWVKYLQMTRNLKQLKALHLDVGISHRRKMARYRLPKIYEKYILMKVHLPDRCVSIGIIDFCQRGAQFQSPEPLKTGTEVECTLSTMHNIKKTVRFRIRIKYCCASGDGYLIGAHIDEVGDSSEFNFFNNIYDFISEIEKGTHSDG